MASIDQELKSNNFASEQVKANLNVMFTANWINNQVSAFLKPYNLTHEQFNVLRILRGKHPESMCQRDILQRMIARQSNLTLIVKKLKTKELIDVCKSDYDRREYVIRITESGLDMLSKIDKESLPSLTKMNQLSEKDARLLNELLDALREA